MHIHRFLSSRLSTSFASRTLGAGQHYKSGHTFRSKQVFVPPICMSIKSMTFAVCLIGKSSRYHLSPIAESAFGVTGHVRQALNSVHVLKGRFIVHNLRACSESNIERTKIFSYIDPMLLPIRDRCDFRAWTEEFRRFANCYRIPAMKVLGGSFESDGAYIFKPPKFPQKLSVLRLNSFHVEINL